MQVTEQSNNLSSNLSSSSTNKVEAKASVNEASTIDSDTSENINSLGDTVTISEEARAAAAAGGGSAEGGTGGGPTKPPPTGG